MRQAFAVADQGPARAGRDPGRRGAHRCRRPLHRPGRQPQPLRPRPERARRDRRHAPGRGAPAQPSGWWAARSTSRSNPARCAPWPWSMPGWRAWSMPTSDPKTGAARQCVRPARRPAPQPSRAGHRRGAGRGGRPPPDQLLPRQTRQAAAGLTGGPAAAPIRALSLRGRDCDAPSRRVTQRRAGVSIARLTSAASATLARTQPMPATQGLSRPNRPSACIASSTGMCSRLEREADAPQLAHRGIGQQGVRRAGAEGEGQHRQRPPSACAPDRSSTSAHAPRPSPAGNSGSSMC